MVGQLPCMLELPHVEDDVAVSVTTPLTALRIRLPVHFHGDQRSIATAQGPFVDHTLVAR
jgi:hypothetical protein